MDFSLATVGGAAGIMSASQVAMMGATCFAILGCELPHRVAGLRPGSMTVREYAGGAAKLARRCAPEVIGVSACLTLAVLLRLRGDTDVYSDPMSQQVWEQIKKEWPILMGADTLLNLQTWLRLVVLMFVAARAEATKLPLSGMAAALLLASMVARTSLAVQTSWYRLEGPLALGGDLPIACEVAMLPRLAMLSVEALRTSPVAASVVVSVTTWFASHHFLNLAQDPSVDRLFTAAHAFETVAACAYFLNTVMHYCSSKEGDRSGYSASAGFMHLVMPAQAALAAYYFLTAFEPSPNLVGSGRPFCLLCIGNLLQLGLYMISMALHLSGCFDSSEDSPAQREPMQVPVDSIDATTDDVFAGEESGPVGAAQDQEQS